MGTQQSLPIATPYDPPHSNLAAPRDLTGQITLYKNNPVACGGFADVFRVTWRRARDAVEIEVVSIYMIAYFDDR